MSTTPETPMDKQTVGLLATYLLLATILTGYTIFSLWSAQPQAATGDVPQPSCDKATNPVLTNVYPESLYVGSTGDVLLLGCRFPATTQVKFNGTQHAALVVDSSHIRVGLSGADVAAAGTVVVTLSNGASDFGSGVLKILPTGVYWRSFGIGPWPISQEVQLLLLVLFTGAFGSCVYALKSLADYRGDHILYASWFTQYMIQPFEGAGTAFLLYLIVRGGFLAGAGGDVKAVNQFGMCAIAGLAGAFSDTAFLKLREVFQTLFKPQDDRGGKLVLKITTTSLPDGPVGTAYKQTLQTSGGKAPLKWSVNPPLPTPLTLDTTTGTISGTPTVALKANFTFTVTDSATPPASASADLTLEIKPGAAAPRITTTKLPDGVVNTAYPSTILQATGGTSPLKWSVTPALPATGPTLNAATGAITGTPTTALPKSKFTFTVTDSATPAASSSVDLTLEIK